jgi:hypothetical protein
MFPPLHSPNRAHMARDAQSPEAMIYSFIHISQQSPVKELFHEVGGKPKVTVHGTPRGRKVYIQWSAAWFPKGIVNDNAITTPVLCSLQHDPFHLGLGRPELL